jgi:hypothetical protein
MDMIIFTLMSIFDDHSIHLGFIHKFYYAHHGGTFCNAGSNTNVIRGAVARSQKTAARVSQGYGCGPGPGVGGCVWGLGAGGDTLVVRKAIIEGLAVRVAFKSNVCPFLNTVKVTLSPTAIC